MYAAAALGVADQLVAGPAPAEVLAERAGAHAPSLYRLVRTLASVGVFTEPEPGVFNLTPLGQALTSGQPGSMRDVVIMFMETHYAPFGDLTRTIRTGQPAAEHLYGEPFFTWLSPHPGQAERYTAAMANLTGGFKTAAIASLPLDDTHTIVDVGGADGTVLAAILGAHPHLRGVLFDLPTSSPPPPRPWPGRASKTGPNAWAATSSNRCWPAAYLLSLVLHDWPDQQAQRILANIAAAGRGARLLVLDFVVPAGDAPHMSKISDLNMLAMMGGKERTGPEWRELLEGTGFTGIEIRQTGTPFQSSRQQRNNRANQRMSG